MIIVACLHPVKRVFHLLFFSISESKKPLNAPLLVSIARLNLNSKVKKFNYSFMGGKGNSPPFGGEQLFVYSLRRLNTPFSG